MKYFLSLIVASTFCTPVYANDMPDFFHKFLVKDKAFHREVNLKAERIFKLSQPQCTEFPELTRLEPTILTAPAQRPEITNKTIEKKTGSENEDKEEKEIISPIYGQWIERTKATACEKNILINQLAIAYENDPPILYPLINGYTLLDPIDQPFAEQAISERLEKLDKPCQSQPFTLDSQIIGYRSSDGQSIEKQATGYGWFERWSVRACETEYTANIAIVPDPRNRYNYIARIKK